MRRLLPPVCPEAEALAATSQAVPLPDGSVDGVFAAEAFHWFDDERAVGEIARVLRPGGAVVLLWNVPAGPWEPSTATAEELLGARGPAPGEVDYDPLDLAGPRRPPGGGALGRPPFGPLIKVQIEHVQTLDRDGLVSYYASMGWLADLADGERLPLLDAARELLLEAAYRRVWIAQVHWARCVGRRPC
jgi:SAM-dependent methyltransferase